MLHRYTAVIAAALLCAGIQAQERDLLGFRLENHLRSADPDMTVSLFLEGSTSEVDRVVKEHGGAVVMKMRNWTSVRMPAGEVLRLNSETAVRSIHGFSYGQTLNDTMRAKTRIDDVQAGLEPLTRAYDGEGVIMGIIDTGLDLTHPDLHNEDGTTRVLHYWDHHLPVAGNTPVEFGYGQEWTGDEIDTSNPPTGDMSNGGHGTTVAGTAAGNGGNTGRYIGCAPKSELIIVAEEVDGNPFFLARCTDAVKYVFDRAAALGRPAVLNLSLGTYLGSHDGLDPAALLIDSMITAAPGRSVVCATGNSGCFPPYQLRMEVDGDTSFTWIRTNRNVANNAFAGFPGAYIDFWGDTAQMNNIHFSVGIDSLPDNGYRRRGHIPFRTVPSTLDTEVIDTLYSELGNRMCVVNTITHVRGGQYNLEILTHDPDSTNERWRIMMTGDGLCDAWDNNGFGLSEIISPLSQNPPPSVAEYPDMVNYVFPTIDRCVVDSWNCSPHVISVANYNNIQQYTAITGQAVNLNGVEGEIAFCSAYGPTRTGLQKPEIAAPGDVTFSAIPLPYIPLYLGNPNAIVALGADTMHVRAGGTSIASPAVAGAVALYFQQCPYATQAQVKQALIAAAFPDEFTSDGPVARWGAGKLDAFTPMTLNVFDVNVASNDMIFCPGDSSEAMGPPAFEDYLWSDGSTTVNAWSQGEPLALTVLNDLGCLSNSDTLFFTTFPEPTAPVITDAGGILNSTPADAYQWYLNGEEIPGATGQQYTPTENGDYTVVITAPTSCTAESDPYTLLNVGLNGAAGSGFRVWPVPASGTLFVTVQGGSPFTYEIIDGGAGKVVKRGALRADGTSVLDIAALVPGTYTLRTFDGSHNGQRTFVVEK